MYSLWERPHVSLASDWIYADASAHRLISDLSVFIGQQRSHRIIAAGDLNLFHGYGDRGSPYWRARYQTVFDRMAAIGLRFVGPQLPSEQGEVQGVTRNIPTFRKDRHRPETASDQLDLVFASEDIADRVQTSALSGANAWGPSDHCMIQIDLN